MNEDILDRVRRIYAAIGVIEETDPAKLKAVIFEGNGVRAVFQDFRGELTDADFANYAHLLIHNIANLFDHLRRWAKENGRAVSCVNRVSDESDDVRIIRDLSNNDKHGYPPRDGGYSKQSPRIVNLNRVMRLQTRPVKGSLIGMTMGPGGIPRFFGDGSAKAVITADVIDVNDARIGDLYDTANNAVKAWEDLLAEFGFLPKPLSPD